MRNTQKKIQVSFKLEEDLVKALKGISDEYHLLSLTDVVNMLLKNSLRDYGAKEKLNDLVKQYSLGELDTLSKLPKGSRK